MSKVTSNKFIDTVDECVTNGKNHGIFHVSIEDESLNGRNITFIAKKVVNVGSGAYFGLEVDKGLKQAAFDAAICFGAQYSTSRAFSAYSLYDSVEYIFYKIFGNDYVILATTTTLSVEKEIWSHSS